MTPTHDLLAGVAIRVNALRGTDEVELQETYSTRPLTNANFNSSIFAMNAIRDSCVQAQGTLGGAIALSDNRSARASLRSVTSALASGASLPSTDSSGFSIIGNYGDVYDGSDSSVLTRMPVALVRNRLLSPTIFLAPAYYYALAGGQILHTRTTAILECCIYDNDTQTTVFDNNGPMILADDLAEAVICGACAMLFRDDEFTDQATRWAGYFATALAAFPPAKMEQAA